MLIITLKLNNTFVFRYARYNSIYVIIVCFRHTNRIQIQPTLIITFKFNQVIRVGTLQIHLLHQH
jgi:hypothetical protein